MNALRLRTTFVALLFIGIFPILMLAMQPGHVAELFNGIVFCLSLAVIITYIPPFFRAVFHSRPSSSEYLLMGIVVSWAAIGLHRGEAMIWRALGKPDWMTDHWTWILFIYFNILGATLHLTAPGAIDGRVPRRNWIYWGLSVAAGVGIALVVLWTMGPGDLPFLNGKAR